MRKISLKKRFPEHSEEREKFIKRWNEMHREGSQNILAEEFGISIPSVYRMRKLLGLEPLYSPNHQGRKEFCKRVKKLYLQHESTAKVGRVLGMSASGINKILISQGVPLGEQYTSNVLFNSPQNGMSASKFNKAVKDMYVNEKLTAHQIGKLLKVDPQCVSKRLRAMNITLKQSHQFVEGGYPCRWCNKIMEKVWIARGQKKQLYCNGSCKSRAKDYRKFKRATETIERFEAELKQNFGDCWEEARDTILGDWKKDGLKKT